MSKCVRDYMQCVSAQDQYIGTRLLFILPYKHIVTLFINAGHFI